MRPEGGRRAGWRGRATAVAVGVAACAVLGACGGAPRYGRGGPAGREPVIRVLLAEGRRAVRIDASGAWRVEAGGMRLMEGTRRVRIVVRVRGGGVEVHAGDDVAGAPDGVRIAGTLAFDGVRWPGALRVERTGTALRVIDDVPVETYLEGVVPHEIGDPGPDAFAAVEAQAVAARTYALGRMRERRDDAFDVYADVRDQVFRSLGAATRLVRAAIRETRGMVLEYDGRPAATYYCATCGGHTSDVRVVWPQRDDAPYLHGVRDADDTERAFCADARNFRWRIAFSGRRLGTILRRTLPREAGAPRGGVGRLVDLAIVGRSASGRVSALDVVTTRGRWRVRGDRIRWALSPEPARGRILPSTLFDLEIRRRRGRIVRVDVIGGGNGHGVGMCQHGAVGMARRGYGWRMILQHYYPGTRVRRAW